MKKISIQIKDDTLYFKYRVKVKEPNLLNTNVISNNELIFSDEYILENQKIVGLFIADLAKDNNIKNITVSSNELGELVVNIVKKLSSIEVFKIDADENMTYALCEAICSSNNIKSVNCYGIPEFMIESLDKNGVKVDSRYEVLFTSNFMAENKLTSFSKIYYKNSITVGNILTKDDFQDIRTFCNINKYLRTIHFDRYNYDDLKKIVKILNETGKKNIVLQIHDDIEDLDEIAKLKALNKELKNKDKLKIQLVYSEDYISKNYVHQVTFTILKTCSLLIFLIIAVVFGFVTYNNYKSEEKIQEITENIQIVLEEANNEIAMEERQPTIDSNGKMVINSYDKLREINPDTVGWLSVKGTKISYPVVKTTDNSYYLNRNYYKNKDYNGWVFMDYRNNFIDFDDNTIIYAHNRYANGMMFGTLQRVSQPNFYNNDSNLYITFNTLYEEHQWKIFSFYSIDVTSDYLRNIFLDDELDQKQEFINLIKDRSEVPFKTPVSVKDKILTLSTCLDNNQRFVVHAVLVK